ncbi:probable G-protein coupled receptor Mth-like 11 [Drosophila eugracilis]|uniref:probable G-protein coupled receptor Mth-like 11 n=1 Tax=Drosophila eugracilis TaxID=29029 RepID=UPI0007E6F2FE|nr:probable G-protein coupled receptor Mth-like 11 [Drosophila eugracilis]
MGKLILQQFILSILVIVVTSKDIPNCDFFDTAKLNNSDMLADGSYKYEDIIIPSNLTGEYDYVINYDGDEVSVPKHIRGCVCKFKTCIRFCCHPKKQMGIGNCYKKIYKNLTYDHTLNITHHNGSVIEKHIFNDMFVQQDLPVPCQQHYVLNAKEKVDKWDLYENGSFFRHYDKRFLSKQEFCLQPRKMKNHTLIVAYNCFEKKSMKMAYFKMSSVFFMAITIFAYLWLPKFQSLHGKCCNLYFICLALAFSLNVASMFSVFEVYTCMCYLTGYTGYFTVMATFLWLSVISFDVWRRFAMRRFQDFYNNNRSSFFNYNVIVWSTAGFLTLIIFVVDLFVVTDMKNPYNPAVGVVSCWIYSDGWSAMYYFFAPLALLIILNGTMFFLTTRYIYVENKKNQKVLNKCEQQRQSRNQANYRVYLRLFIIMGGSWFLEIIAFICRMEDVCKLFVEVSDYINCSQGIIIFVATFCNQEMLKSIRKRIQNGESTNTDCNSTSRPPDNEKVATVEYRK